MEFFFWSVFSCIWIEYGKIWTSKNSVFGHFSRSVCLTALKLIIPYVIWFLTSIFTTSMFPPQYVFYTLHPLDKNFLLPSYISTAFRVATHSRTLIDNMFSKYIEDGLISRNIIFTIQDHSVQFLFMNNMKIEQKERI